MALSRNLGTDRVIMVMTIMVWLGRNNDGSINDDDDKGWWRDWRCQRWYADGGDDDHVVMVVMMIMWWWRWWWSCGDGGCIGIGAVLELVVLVVKVMIAIFLQDIRSFEKADFALVGERGVSLSGGQKARINLARWVCDSLPNHFHFISVVRLETENEHQTRRSKQGHSLVFVWASPFPLFSCHSAAYYEADVFLLDDPLSAVDMRVGKQLFEECVESVSS